MTLSDVWDGGGSSGASTCSGRIGGTSTCSVSSSVLLWGSGDVSVVFVFNIGCSCGCSAGGICML